MLIKIWEIWRQKLEHMEKDHWFLKEIEQQITGDTQKQYQLES